MENKIKHLVSLPLNYLFFHYIKLLLIRLHCLEFNYQNEKFYNLA